MKYKKDGEGLISSDILRGYNDIIVLGLLLNRDSYGYSLIQEISRRSGGTYQMKETTLYSVLSRLEKNELITSYSGNETMGRKRTYFHITPNGERFFLEKCKEWTETKELIDRFTIDPTTLVSNRPALNKPPEEITFNQNLRKDLQPVIRQSNEKEHEL